MKQTFLTIAAAATAVRAGPRTAGRPSVTAPTSHSGPPTTARATRALTNKNTPASTPRSTTQLTLFGLSWCSR